MTPAEYVNEIVVPTVLELRDDTRSRRRAYLACIAVFHVKDHLSKAGETGIESAMRAATGEAFDVVRGVCNGTKHVRTDRGHVIAFTSGDDYDVPPAFADMMIVDVSYLDDTVGGREIETPSGVFDLYAVASTTLKTFVQCYPMHLGACDLSGL